MGIFAKLSKIDRFESCSFSTLMIDMNGPGNANDEWSPNLYNQLIKDLVLWSESSDSPNSERRRDSGVPISGGSP